MSAEKASHTPGPWHVTGCLDLWVEPVGAPDDGAFHGIAHCGDIHWPDYETKQTEWEANARLIASAPTLAAELAKLRDACSALLDHWGRHGDVERFVISDVSDDCAYWSPAARMVDSQYIATIREALAKGRPG